MCILRLAMNTSKLKSFGVDVLGVLLIIAAAITSPIPGPGGLPLLILGLSLLATNHEWAARWLQTVKRHGVNLSNRLFSDKPLVRWGIDIAAIALITVAVLLLTHVTRSTARTAAISLLFASLFLMLGNRERFTKLKNKLFKHK